MEGKKRAKKAQESGVTAEMGEITIVSWGEWIRDIVWEDVDQKQAEKENEENGQECFVYVTPFINIDCVGG